MRGNRRLLRLSSLSAGQAFGDRGALPSGLTLVAADGGTGLGFLRLNGDARRFSRDEGLSGATTKRPSLLRCLKAMPDRKPPQRELAETPKQEKSQGMDIGLSL